MGTRKKLLLGALGFVAATTTLALWQAVPKIERVARRLPMLDSCDEELYWLSNHEVIVGSTRHTAPTYIVPRIVDLTTGKERPLPIMPKLTKTGGQVFDDPYRNGPLPSPDGKWLLHEEGITNHEGDRRTGWLLVRSDGSEKRRLPAPTTEKERYDRKTFWLPDSSGWYVFWCNYRGVSGADASYQKWLDRHDLSGKRVSSRRIRYEPEKILSDGHLAYKGFLDAIVLCRPDSFDACEALPDQYQYPSASSVTDEVLSYDTKNRFMILTMQNKQISDQNFWEALFHHSLPRAHREFWLVSRDGKKSRCLATDDVSNIPDGDSFSRILSWSPDGKRVLLSSQRGHSMESRVYLLEL
nr:hypothetical protein [Armatimonas sp.]